MDNKEVAAKFLLNLANYIEGNGYGEDSIHNADECGLTYKALPGKSVMSEREQSASKHKVNKERI